MKKNMKGFTLAELLIAVAIIAVLVAISIPIFNNQLKKARLATNQANARAAYAAIMAEFISNDDATKLSGLNSRVSSSIRNGYHIIYAYNTKTGTVVTDLKDYGVVYSGDPNDHYANGFTAKILNHNKAGSLTDATCKPDITTWETNFAPFGLNENGHGNLSRVVYPYWAVAINADGSVATYYASNSTNFGN